MKEYKKHEDKPMVVNEPLVAYAASTNGQLVSTALMDELMGQPNEVKWYIINRLMESMKHNNDAEAVEKLMLRNGKRRLKLLEPITGRNIICRKA